MDYDTESIFVRPETQNSAKFAAGTYKKGQLVAFNTSTNLYVLFVAGGANGTGTIRAVCKSDAVLGSAGYLPIARGECSLSGVAAVMAALTTPITLTDALKAQCFDAGIILN